MKPHLLLTKIPSSFRSVALALCLTVGLTIGAASSHGQALLSFTGGGGTPLTLTLLAPVTYKITLNNGSSGASSDPFFLFQGLGNGFPRAFVGGTGSITFTLNGGSAQTINTISSGYANSDTQLNDTYIYGSLPGITVGNTLVLNAGTFTTASNYSGVVPTSGSYRTFIIDNFGSNVSTNGTAGAPLAPVATVPDTGTTLAMLLGSVGLLLGAQRFCRA